MKRIKNLKRKITVFISSIFGCGMLVSCYGMPMTEDDITGGDDGYIDAPAMYGMPAFIDGTVYDDKNGNNKFDEGEGIPGIQFEVTKDGKVEKTGKTDVNGDFDFMGSMNDFSNRKVNFSDSTGIYKDRSIEVSDKFFELSNSEKENEGKFTYGDSPDIKVKLEKK